MNAFEYYIVFNTLKSLKNSNSCNSHMQTLHIKKLSFLIEKDYSFNDLIYKRETYF